MGRQSLLEEEKPGRAPSSGGDAALAWTRSRKKGDTYAVKQADSLVPECKSARVQETWASVFL